MTKYSDLSYSLTKMLSKDEKKEHGIYFTPPDTVQRTLSALVPFCSDVKTVLEPSCGSGEYVRALVDAYPSAKIDAVEFNKRIYDGVKTLSSDHVTITHSDFLAYKPSTSYDLIIGNPPYAVLKKSDVKKEYHPYFDGRPNIFVLFILKSLEHLSDKGILSFILPKNFMNCLYYDKTRKYISSSFQILHIEERTDAYIETKQETILFIIQKSKSPKNDAYVLKRSGYTIFGDVRTLATLYKDSTTLDTLGFTASVGTVVWNQCKDILTDDPSKTRLVYSSDISNNEFVPKTYSNKEKKNFINKKGSKEPLLVINRGYGVGSYAFEYCLLQCDFEYLVENHLICIRSKTGSPNVEAFHNIIASLTNKKTQEFINVYFGNNAINTTELTHILPIYI